MNSRFPLCAFASLLGLLPSLGLLFLTGASPAVSMDHGFLSAMAGSLPMAEVQTFSREEYIEIAIQGTCTSCRKRDGYGIGNKCEALMSYFGNRLTLGYTDLLYVDIMNLDYG
jgi:hypothetical protein